MKDLDEIKALFEEHKLNEFRRRRPSDIAGGSGIKKTDLSTLVKHIKARIAGGEIKADVVKDELVKFWKKKGKRLGIDSIVKKINKAHDFKSLTDKVKIKPLLSQDENDPEGDVERIHEVDR